MILIDGRAGAGKSTLANRLAVALGGTASGGAGTFKPDAPLAESAPVQILHGDDMYEGWAGPATIVDILLGRILGHLASGRDGSFEMWDWAADARSHTIAVCPRPWLIIEGVGVGLPRARVGGAHRLSSTRRGRCGCSAGSSAITSRMRTSWSVDGFRGARA